jgi:hypothetical protein
MPMMVAMVPAFGRSACSIVVRATSAPASPSRPRSCSVSAPLAASSSNTAPAMATAITNSGAMERIV